MAARNIYVYENGKKIRNTANETIDFLSIKIGSDAMEIKETSGKFDFGARELSNISNASADTSAAGWGQVKTYVAQQVVSGGTVKQNLLTEIQLDNTLGILPGLVTFFTTNAVDSDTVVLKDAAGNTETYTFKDTPSGTFDVAVGGTVAISMSNLSASINTNSVYWKAYYDTSVLASLYAAGLIGIYRKSDTDNAFKIWVTGTVAGDVTNYHGLLEYTTSSSVLIALVNSEPANAQSGFSIAKAGLTNGEIHNVIAEDKLKYWNADYSGGTGAWFTMSEGVIPVSTSGSGGAILGKVTFDSDKGVEVTGIGIAKAKVDGTSMHFDGSGNIAIAANGVSAAKLNADTAGAGLVLNGVSNALDVNVGDGLELGGTGSDFVKIKPDATGGANLAKAANVGANGLAIKVDDSSIEGDSTSGQLKVKALGIATGMLAANSVTAAKLNADTAGAGLVLNGVTNALEVNAGNGISTSGDAVAVVADPTGGANLAKAINVSSNGVAVKIDDLSVKANASNQLYIPGAYASLVNDNAGTITVGQIVYVKSNGHVDLAKADALSTCSGKLGIVMDATIATTAPGNIWLMEGLPVALFTSLTLSVQYFLSAATAGAITTTAPSTVTNCIVPLGKSAAINTTLCFNPEEVVEILS